MSLGITDPSGGELGQVIEEPDFRGCTALVLGAGASAPYGFPTGRQLVEDICQQFPDFFTHLDSYGSTPRERRARSEDLVRMLKESACISIDEFLALHAMDNELLHLGKIAITSSLLPKEDNGKLRETMDWYQDLICWWCTSRVQLGVITFNYDRSFEQSFYSGLSARVGERCARGMMLINATKRINVMHVHGQFGYLPWDIEDPNALPYGIARGDPQAWVMKAAGQLRLMFEPPSRMVIAEARHTLTRASRVLFLGFGYDTRNLERIVPNWEGEVLPRNAAIAGTAYGLNALRVAEVGQQLRRWAGDLWEGRPDIVPMTVLQFIRDTNWPGQA